VDLSSSSAPKGRGLRTALTFSGTGYPLIELRTITVQSWHLPVTVGLWPSPNTSGGVQGMCGQCETIRLQVTKGEDFARNAPDALTSQRLREYIEKLKAELAALEASPDHVKSVA
jgi:hypothetical protein